MARKLPTVKINSARRYSLTPTEVSALTIMAGVPEITVKMPATYSRLRSRLKSDFAKSVGEVIVASIDENPHSVEDAAILQTAEVILGRKLKGVVVNAKPFGSEVTALSIGHKSTSGHNRSPRVSQLARFKSKSPGGKRRRSGGSLTK